jgi:murein DD-endopeptidase MepM/ murein hydrolase activator NlpD
MSTLKTGRHVRPKKKGVSTALATAVVLGAGMALPVFLAGNANAATLDEWERVAQCESDGNWSLPGGDRDSTGGLQFRIASWLDALSYLRSKGVDTSAYPSMAYQATKQQQIMAGEALLAMQGPRAWSVTFNGGAHCGNAAGGALSTGSMFEGGPNPYPGGSTPSTPPSTPTTPTPKPSTPKPSTPAPKPSTPSTSDKYTVKRGDTLSKIAVAHRVEGGWQKLYAENKAVVGSNPNLIFPGQKLSIPAVKYVVKKGDHLTKIASKLGIEGGWKALYEKNKDVIGDNPNLIEPGMVLVVSGTAKGSAPSTPSTPKPSTPATPKPSTPVSNGWVAPLAKGTYRIGDNIIVGSGCISRSCGGHSGLDLSAPQGTPAKALSAGTVIHAGYGYAGAAYGNHVVVQLADGKYALYGHLATNTVVKGQKVAAGQMVGTVGSTGNSSGPHLHFEIRVNPNQFYVGNFLNPVSYLAGKGVSI